ncbi:MAG: MTAP family purine nucleoside phosphorylase [Bdellovibrionales bacterium]|nr:MTAP family purine nucleoside phosphorylase [Bdellovibrionales bacterium]
MWAVIGGSGFEKFDGFQVIEELDRSTPFGEASSGFKKVSINGEECLFLSRHGAHHELLPSEVNFRANIFALKKYGAKAIISFSAVGSLRAELKPGDMVVSTQYMDRTKGLRTHTFCGDGVVGHMSLAKPVNESMVKKLKELCKSRSWDCHFDKTYICIEGPNFSTIAESEHYRAMGADIIGMTHFPEYALAREAGLSYLSGCFVTDYDCWDQSRPHVTLEEVIDVMRKNNSKAFELLTDILKSKDAIYKDCSCANEGLRTGLMTPWELISADKKQWLDVLRG